MKCETCKDDIGKNHAHYIEVTALIPSKGSSILSKIPTGNLYCLGCVGTKRKEIEGQLSMIEEAS